MPEKMRIGFLGAGRMATTLAQGFSRAGLVDGLLASDPSEAAREQFAQASGGAVTQRNMDVLKYAKVVILAVKPGQVLQVLQEIRPAMAESHTLFSIAAGVPISRIESELFDGARVVRVMPNTPALCSSSATAYCVGSCATPEDASLARSLFSSVGLAVQVPESLMDAVTGLSGSGPAYACLFIEALSDGGVAAGLPRDMAIRLAAQTVLGTAKMVLETQMHPGALKDMVTSPGGTTIEGVHELEKGGFRGTVMNAVRAASEKSKKLGQ